MLRVWDTLFFEGFKARLGESAALGGEFLAGLDPVEVIFAGTVPIFWQIVPPIFPGSSGSSPSFWVYTILQ